MSHVVDLVASRNHTVLRQGHTHIHRHTHMPAHRPSATGTLSCLVTLRRSWTRAARDLGMTLPSQCFGVGKILYVVLPLVPSCSPPSSRLTLKGPD